ncbi:hypothetical protein SDC9_183385 [bioreactor metagenome]|uniref:Uncharacterized protein n=1 Tax=bioreactor metagenome TaxID=1076179 RepID=A0A645HJQ7_9ZZZZ
MAVGVASPIAQGQAMTSTAVRMVTANDRSFPAASQAIEDARAMTMTIGTNTAATLSAMPEMGAFFPWASCTKRTMRLRTVSCPTRVTVIYSAPCWLSEPPITSLFWVFSTGMLSPVRRDSSTADSPLMTLPSSGTLLPGRTSRVSPAFTLPVGTSVTLPSSLTRMAVSGESSISLRIASVVFSLLLASICLPIMTRETTMPADS